MDMGSHDWGMAESLSLVGTGSGPTNYYTDTAEPLPPAPQHTLLRRCAHSGEALGPFIIL